MGKELSISRKIFFFVWLLYYIYMILNGIFITKGSMITLIFNGSIFLYCIVYTLKNSYLWSKFGFLYLFLLFIFILILLSSSDFFVSLKIWMKYSIGIMCFPIGFDLLCNKESIKKLWSIFQLFLWLFLFNYLCSNFFHWGESQYGADIAGADMGSLFDDALHTNLCILTIMPFMLYSNKKIKIIHLLLGSFSIVLTIVSMKRLPIICLCLTIMCFFFLWQYLKKKYAGLENLGLNVLKRPILIGIIAIGIFVLLFQDTINLQYNARLNRFQAGLENEGRTRELVHIAKDILYNEKMHTFLLGKETFNTVGTYANGIFGRRMIHENYGIMLNGTGVIGTSIYIFLNFYLLLLFFRYTGRVNFCGNPKAYFLYIAYISYWLMFTAASFSGTIWLMLYPSVHYMVSGMILRYFYEYGELDYAEYLEKDH